MDNFSNLIKEDIGFCLLLRDRIVKPPGNKQPIEMLVEKADENFKYLKTRRISFNDMERSKKN